MIETRRDATDPHHPPMAPVRHQRDDLFVPMPAGVRWAVALGTLAIAAGIGVVNIAQKRGDLLVLYAALLVHLAVILVPIFFYRRHWGIFHPLVFTSLWVGLVNQFLRRVPMYAVGLDFHEALPGYSSSDLSWVITKYLLLNTLGFVAVYAGFFVGPWLRQPHIVFGRPRFVFLKLLVVAAVAIVAVVVLVRHAGGFEQLMMQRSLRSDLRIAARIGGHWHVLAGILAPACLLWLGLSPHAWKRLPFLTLFLISLAIRFVTTGSRSAVVAPLLFAAMIWALQRRRLPYGAMVVLALVGITIVGIIGEYRKNMFGVTELKDLDVEVGAFSGLRAGVETLTSYSGQASGELAIVATVPRDVRLLYGDSYLSVLAAPIPRAIWRNKPNSAGRLTSERIFGQTEGGPAYPAGPVTEAYWNLHIPGVILVMFAYGAFLRWLADLYRRNAPAAWIVAFYPITLFALLPASDAVYVWLHLIAPVVVCIVVFCGLPRLGKKAKAAQHAGPAGIGAPRPGLAHRL